MKPFYFEGQVEADGETLTLVCDFGAINAIEGVTGQDWDEIIPQLLKPSSELAVTVLWGLLRRKHEGVTIDQAAGVVFGKDKSKVGDCAWDVIQRAIDFGEGKAEPDSPKKKPDGQSQPSESSG